MSLMLVVIQPPVWCRNTDSEWTIQDFSLTIDGNKCSKDPQLQAFKNNREVFWHHESPPAIFNTLPSILRLTNFNYWSKSLYLKAVVRLTTSALTSVQLLFSNSFKIFYIVFNKTNKHSFLTIFQLHGPIIY